MALLPPLGQTGKPRVGIGQHNTSATLQGSFFRSDERMTHYIVTNSRGSFQSSDFGGSTESSDSAKAAQDSMLMNSRQKATPVRNSNQ